MIRIQIKALSECRHTLWLWPTLKTWDKVTSEPIWKLWQSIFDVHVHVLLGHFLMARTVPPNFVKIGPKLRVGAPLSWHKPKTAKNRGEPQKMTPSSETEFFLGWFQWESCSPGYSGHLLHWQKSRSLNKKLTFGPKYPNFGVKKAHFRP